MIVGAGTLLTVTALPVRSATTTAGSAAVSQSSAAARLKVAPPVEVAPLLFSIWLTAARSVALIVTVKLVSLLKLLVSGKAVEVKV